MIVGELMKHYLKTKQSSFIIFILFFCYVLEGKVTPIKPKCSSCYSCPRGPQGPAGVDATGNNYLFIYDTTSQVIAVPDTPQNITFDTHDTLDGWVADAQEPEFICPQTGLYHVMYSAEVDNILVGEGTVEIFVLVDNQSIDKSRTVVGIAQVGIPVVVSRSFLHSFQAGQKIKMCIEATDDGARLEGSTQDTVIPSVSLTILRIK